MGEGEREDGEDAGIRDGAREGRHDCILGHRERVPTFILKTGREGLNRVTLRREVLRVNRTPVRVGKADFVSLEVSESVRTVPSREAGVPRPDINRRPSGGSVTARDSSE